MDVAFNDLSRAADAERPDLMEVIERVVRSGWFVLGPEVQAFENELADYVGASEAVGVGNGTEALELAIKAADHDRKGVVVTTANCGGYATTAARAAGCDVRYCDIDRDTMLMDPRALCDVLDDRVTAIVVTHLYGRVADVPALREALGGRPITIIEDCAQAIGGCSEAGRAGGMGDLATFSFYPTKNLAALGDGGAITTSDTALARRVKTLRQYGWTQRYEVSMPGGMNSRLDETQAAVLRYRLPLVARGNERRRAIAERYGQALPASTRLLSMGDGHAAHLCVVETASADRLASYLASHGVGTAVHFPTPDYRQPAWLNEEVAASVPNTEAVRGKLLSLPCYPELREAEIDHVCERLRHYV